MTAELPDGFDPEMQSRLKDKLGESWADQLVLKWGTEWPLPCGQELERSLGYGWESQPPDIKSQTLLQLIAAPAPAEDSAPPEDGWRDDDHADNHSTDVAVEAPAYDERAWQEYLAENGPQWDGTEAAWTQFSEWFAYHAHDRGLAAPAAALLSHLVAQPVTERITTLAQYGVTIRTVTQPAASGSGEPAYDEHAWQEYITQNGRQWDGTAATWDQFSEWFAYYAGERGFAAPAAALLRYLASQPVTERTATLWPAGEPASAEPGSAEEPESPGKPEASAEDIESIMRELLEENPEFADLAEETRREIVIEAINEALAEEA